MNRYGNIEIITQQAAIDIIENRYPYGLFVQADGDRVIGIDNQDGNAWVDEFATLQECLDWLIDAQEEEPENWFGMVRWCDADLENALEVAGFEPTAARVGLLRSRLEDHSFTDVMIECGWDVIYQAIAEVFKK
jgi:hypothetical protein